MGFDAGERVEAEGDDDSRSHRSRSDAPKDHRSRKRKGGKGDEGI